ncbi:C-type lectin 37Da-like [Drosophila obscura]|uniref:C-type lectin 37Da-like n=1 Tax=Drosophila obscura TaxID=7282 RepID=UPI001BB11AEB|nr:C-type lectin 37Da-like [Drosophila obscura]
MAWHKRTSYWAKRRSIGKMFARFTLCLAALGLLSLAGAYNITSHVVDGVPEDLNIATAPFVQIGDGYYYIVEKESSNWFQAYLACHEMGAELVSFETREELDAIDAYMGPADGFSFLWTSGTDAAVKGEHVWFTSGEPLPSTVWGYAQPDDQGGNERCDVLNRTGAVLPRIDDAECGRRHGYICEAPRPKTASFVIW